MFMKFICPTVLSFGLISSFAMAQPQLQIEPNKSYYQQVLDWSLASTPVKFEEIQGAHLGTCFYFFEPNTAYAATLVADNVSKAGPAFPGRNVYQVFATHIDRLLKAKNYLLLNEKHCSVATEERDGLTMFWDMEPNGRPDTQSTVGRYGNYIVQRTVELIGQNYYYDLVDRIINIPKGKIESACYYYQPLTQ